MLPSHAAFVPGIAIAVAQSPPLPELALLQSSVLALSLAYHRNFERAGALAQAEGASAKLLFLYGATQTLANCPAAQPGLFGAEACCLGLTLGCFVGTNFAKGLYERWHPWGLHVVPGVWSSLVALEHTSLLPPGVVDSLPDSWQSLGVRQSPQRFHSRKQLRRAGRRPERRPERVFGPQQQLARFEEVRTARLAACKRLTTQAARLARAPEPILAPELLAPS